MDASTTPIRVTKDDLKKIMTYASQEHLEAFCEPLNTAMAKYGINTKLRVAAFLGQLAHESGELRYTQEIADGHAYEGRADLGNVQPGDGPKYKGRGLIQITGRFNYALYSKYTGVDFLTKPELLEGPVYASDSAGWFWSILKRLNRLADLPDFRTITLRVNGGLTAEAQRETYYSRAKQVLGI